MCFKFALVFLYFEKDVKKMKKKLISLLGLLLFSITLAQFNVDARAGGGGGGGGGGGYHRHRNERNDPSDSHDNDNNSEDNSPNTYMYIALFVLAGPALKGFSIMRKQYLRKKLHTHGIDYIYMEKEITNAYFAIQKAWAQGDMTPAKSYMTQRLFENHQQKLEKMAKSNKKNICEDIQLLSITPISFNQNNELGRLRVKIKVSMIDYTIKIPKENASNNFLSKAWRQTRQKIGNFSSKKYKQKPFEEYWTFIKNSQGNWQLDAIRVIREDNKNFA